MFMEERHQEISDIIKTNGKITVSEITAKYGISDESARRDLRILEQKGICNNGNRKHNIYLSVHRINIHNCKVSMTDKNPKKKSWDLLRL